MRRRTFSIIFLSACAFCLWSCSGNKVGITSPKKDEAAIKKDKTSMGDMVLIPAGIFIMGTDKGQSYEGPTRKVFLSAYYIDRYEVTNAQYQKFINDGGYENTKYWSQEGWDWKAKTRVSYPGFWNGKDYTKNQWGYHHADQPVVGVSWFEAEAFCRWAGKRLPTEAEWEKAARGTDGRTYPWGEDSPDCSYANYDGRCREFPAPVGSYEKGKSPYDLYDMAGNVWEWVSDWFSMDYFKVDSDREALENPKGPSSGDLKTRKGGGWYYTEENVRTYARWRNPPWYRDHPGIKGCPIGFRCARDAD